VVEDQKRRAERESDLIAQNKKETPVPDSWRTLGTKGAEDDEAA